MVNNSSRKYKIGEHHTKFGKWRNWGFFSVKRENNIDY